MRRILTLSKTILGHPGMLGLLAANVAFGMAISFVVPYMSMWGTQHVKMSPVVFGWFMTLTSVSSIVLSTVMARLSDTRVMRRTVLILGSLGGIVGYVGYAFLEQPWALTLVGCAAIGLSAANFSQLFAHLREELERPENAYLDAPLIMSVLRVSFSLAWTVGPAIGAYVMTEYGYRGIFLGAAILFFFFLAGVLRYVPARPHPPHVHPAKHESIFRVLGRPAIWISVIAFTAVFAAHSINLMNLPLLVTEQLGGTEKDVGIIFGVAPFAEMPLMLWTGQLAARGKTMLLLRIGAVATVIYFLPLTFVHAPWHIYPLQILSAVSIAILTNITIVFYQDLLPAQPGVATSLFANTFNAGNLLGYFAFGNLVGPVGHRGLFLVCAGLSVLTTVILLFYRQKPRPSARFGAPVVAHA
jgi:SET family sugar efflux transporter-like MFS transporter